jgi:hypothetical protein
MDPGALLSGRRESVHGVSKVFMGLRLRFGQARSSTGRDLRHYAS